MTVNVNINADGGTLAGLFDDSPKTLWRPEDLQSVCESQMAASIRLELESLNSQIWNNVQPGLESQGWRGESFADLFSDPHPPITLLKLTKLYAKVMRQHPENVLPREVAGVIYYASIAAALVRAHARITGLDDASLRQGFRWAMNLPWITPALRQLVSEALGLIELPTINR